MRLFILFLFLLHLKTAFSEEGLTVVAIGDATLIKEKIYFEPLQFDPKFSPIQRKSFNDLTNIFQNDFSFYQKRFTLLETTKKHISNGKEKYDLWNKMGLSYYFTSKVTFEKGKIFITVVGLDVKKRSSLITIREWSRPKKLRLLGHTITDKIYRKLTGKQSIFLSKMTFVSDRNGSSKKPIKELYIMDFDGRNRRRLTYHYGTVISPSFSHDGQKIVYSLIPRGKNIKNIDLYIINLATLKKKRISFKKGINSGAVFMQGDNKLALTLSHVGNAEIFILDLKTRRLRRITNHYGHDVDPSVSRDGKIMSFLSSRPGKAMIYTLDPSGVEKKVKRISFEGRFNATPRFSPDGSEIVFSSWLDNRFDIFKILSNGLGLTRLTKNFGSNEDPSFSLDGEFIAFSSQRVLSQKKAIQDIYIMDREGEILGAVTSNFGNCAAPRWSR